MPAVPREIMLPFVKLAAGLVGEAIKGGVWGGVCPPHGISGGVGGAALSDPNGGRPMA